MPKIDMNEYEAATATSDGDYQRMGAGGYVCAIQAVRTKSTDYGKTIDLVGERQYVKLIFDVIEGDLAGKFSDDYWADESKDWGHQFYLSWKNLGSLKNAIQCLDESNPGFDAMAAFEADAWEQFVGKKMGLVFGEEEYLANDGTVKTRLTFGRIKSVQDIREGRFKVPEKKLLDGGAARQEQAGEPQASGGAGSIYDESLPF